MIVLGLISGGWPKVLSDMKTVIETDQVVAAPAANRLGASNDRSQDRNT